MKLRFPLLTQFIGLTLLHRQRGVVYWLLALSCFFFDIPQLYATPTNTVGTALLTQVSTQIPSPQPYPVQITDTPIPNLSAQAVVVVDVASKAVLYQKHADLRLPPASTTKMVTALVAVDYYDLDQILFVEQPLRVGQTMQLYDQESIRFQNMLYGLLVQSANDAAYEIADQYAGGVPLFVDQMNQRVKEMGLFDTHFVNSIGFDHYNHYSTVHDLAIIGAEVLRNDVLRRMVGTKTITVTDVSGEIEHELNNINQLLGNVEGMSGIKTGWTEAAGECLVSYTQRDQGEIIVAILGSQDRFGETRALVEWVYSNFQWQVIP